jgi:hypothetical protein
MLSLEECKYAKVLANKSLIIPSYLSVKELLHNIYNYVFSFAG